ncbi:MAG: phospho-N-acetylmuramoyl-pentapeptide-transferase [Candidatus Omnitrophica bacterium]|nr:phospho-N-acetylmuramoyl-pentapeptide-transferase [Candidatus Omnitrophota bacterium]
MSPASRWFEMVPAAFLVGAAGCLALGPWAIRRLLVRRWVQPIRHEDCPPLMPLQQAKQGTPTMGGLLVIGVGTAVAAAFGGFSTREGWALLFGLGGVGLIGLADDWLKLRRPNAKGLRCLPKLLAAMLVGAGIGWVTSDPGLGYQAMRLPWLGRSIELGGWWIPAASLVIAGSAHAVNLTDGMDGLAAGCLALAFGVFALLGLKDGGSPSLIAWCASLSGACVGFLWFNSFPASVFLGDVGALGLGAALGVLALLSHAALGLVIIGGIFVAEALSVMLQVASYRWRGKRRIFRVAPLHHHFQVAGMGEPKLAVRFWIAGLLLAALGLTALGQI